MRSRFPHFQLRQSASGDLRWEGVLEPVANRLFLISVRYPTHYPYERPQITVEEPALIAGVPHVYQDGSLCIHADRWNPETSTAIGCVPLASAWLLRYLGWLDGQEF